MLSIELNELRIPVRVGCCTEERAFPQILSFDVVISVSDTSSEQSDKLTDTLDYVQVLKVMEQSAREGEWHLLEKLVGDQCRALLQAFPIADEVKVRAAKNRFPQVSRVVVTRVLRRDQL
ncbi:MAG: dihydroneopterin aldolase [Oligoflexia bacterium]|nr:dihydroneopterin aldolase [Oligoflexia bacterium]